MTRNEANGPTGFRRVVQLEDRGERFVLTVDHRPPLAFWTVRWNAQAYHLPMRVIGDEGPDFVRSLADTLMKRPLGGGYIDVGG